MEALLKDIRYGFRMLLRNPGFTAVALLAITLGIAANTTTFSAMDATLFHPFSFPNQDRLLTLWEANPQMGFKRGSVAPGNFNDWREQNHVFDVAGENARLNGGVDLFGAAAVKLRSSRLRAIGNS